MKKLLLLFYFTCCILHFSLAQNPLVKQWDYRFGGKFTDQLNSYQQTADGGLILGGWVGSPLSGDITEPSRGGHDYWIVKIDSVGIKQWDKRFGGSGDDDLFSVDQTKDGGYILGGFSISPISGDKTQDVIGGYDYWIVKTDSLGNKQWDKDFGGIYSDLVHSVKQAKDGGYILGGTSTSPIGGDKTQACCGQYDFWIVKTDSLGNYEWDQDIGGDDQDGLFSLELTSDNGFILGGYSFSDSSCQKTQNEVDTSFNNLYRGDYWIVKTDSMGTIQWDKTFGGISVDILFSVCQVADGGYIMGGYSDSGINGDKTQDTKGDFDYWIIKTDSLGNKQWDKDFGGSDREWTFGNVSQTTDGGYLLAGSSYSGISGDKTENNLGSLQTWVIKTDLLGIKEWDKTVHTNNNNSAYESGFAIQTKDGCYAIANYTPSGIGGDKTQPNWDTIGVITSDYWIVKFCDTTSTTSINQLPDNPNTFSISPNPATDKITISFPATTSENITTKIFSITGEVVYEQKNKTTTPITNYQIPIFNLTNGLYFLSVQTGREVITKKIVVNH